MIDLTPPTTAISWALAAAPVATSETVEDVAVEAAIEAEAYRALALAAIERLAAMEATLRRLRDAHHRLLADYRRLRAGREAV